MATKKPLCLYAGTLKELQAGDDLGLVSTDAKIRHTFAFGDATPAILYTVLSGKHIYTVEVKIITPFDGANPKIYIGDTAVPDRLVQSDQNNPKEAGRYIVEPTYIYGSDTPIYLTIEPSGSSVGSGLITIELQLI